METVAGSQLAQILDVSESKVKYDAAARKLVAQKAILSYILKSTMDEFAVVPVKEIAEKWITGAPQVSETPVHQDAPAGRLNGSAPVGEMATEDVSIQEGTVRYDIRFPVHVPGEDEPIEIIVNIEIQNKDMPGYPIPKRGIYYGARLLSAQRGTVFKNQEYGRIKKVVSIWICENTALSRSDAINEYRFLEKCRRGTYREEEKNYDLMRVIVMRLGSDGENSEDDAVRLLSKMFSTERSAQEKKAALSEEFHINVTEEISQEVSFMCNLSTGILEKGIEKGIEKGMEKGKMKTLFGLVKEGLITISAAAKHADMEPSEFEKEYRDYLK